LNIVRIAENLPAMVVVLSITHNVEYMASWGLKSADLSTCEKVN